VERNDRDLHASRIVVRFLICYVTARQWTDRRTPTWPRPPSGLAQKKLTYLWSAILYRIILRHGRWYDITLSILLVDLPLTTDHGFDGESNKVKFISYW